jgi:hypothetical protein
MNVRTREKLHCTMIFASAELISNSLLYLQMHLSLLHLRDLISPCTEGVHLPFIVILPTQNLLSP